LQAAGVAPEDITVLTAYPMEWFAFFRRDAQSRMWWIACLGGLIGLASASALLWVAETSWPMNVGGLPVFAWWPNLIIMFELTMLGAILATVVTLAVTARLGRRTRLYDPAVADGQILVGVEHPSNELLPAVTRALEVPVGADVKRL